MRVGGLFGPQRQRWRPFLVHSLDAEDFLGSQRALLVQGARLMRAHTQSWRIVERIVISAYETYHWDVSVRFHPRTCFLQ